MSGPAGWYPQSDGQMRYWDGQKWTENVASGIPPVTPPLNLTPPQSPAVVARKNWFLRHKILTALGAVILIGAIGAAASGGNTTQSAPASATIATSTPDSTVATTPAATQAAPASQLGKKVTDGKFAFTVTAVKCGISEVGTGGFTEKAQGEFCKVSLTVANIGDEAQTMFDTNQYAFDAQGRKFSADSTAGLYDDSAQLLFQQINPGNTIKGSVYFDVPKGTKMTQLELHDSLFSGGAKVAL